MPVMYNYSTKKYENVDDLSVKDFVTRGSHGFESKTWVDMYNLDGDPVKVRADEAYKALNNLGYQYRGKQAKKVEYEKALKEATAQKLERQMGPLGAVSAYGTSLASSATLSGSDWLLTKMGEFVGEKEASQQFLKNLGETYPLPSAAGEISGIVGGLGKLKGPLAALNLGSRTMLKTGAKAETIAGKLAAKAGAKGFAKKGLESVTEGVVTDSLYEASRVSRDLALGDDVTLDQAANRVGAAALLGGGLNLGITGTGHAFKKASKAILNGAEKIAKNESTADFLTGIYFAGKGAPTEAKRAFKRALMEPEYRSKMFDVMENIEGVSDDLALDIQKLFSSGTKVSRALQSIKGRVRDTGEIAETAVTDKQLKGWDQLQKTIRKQYDVMEKSPLHYQAKSTIDKTEEAIAYVDEMVTSSKTMSEFIDALEQGKKRLDDSIDYDKMQTKLTPSQGMFKKFRNIFDMAIKDKDIVGGYGKIYGDVNVQIHQFLKTHEALFGRPGQRPGARFGRLMEDYEGAVEVSPGKIQRLIRSPSKNAESRKTIKMLKSYYDKANSISNMASGEIKGLPAADADAIRAIAEQSQAEIAKIKNIVGDVIEIRNSSLVLNAMQEKTGAIMQKPALYGLVGSQLGGPVGTALGVASGIASANPVKSLRWLEEISKGETYTQQLIGKLNRAFGLKTKELGYVGYRALSATSVSKSVEQLLQIEDENKNKSIDDRFDNIINRLKDYSDNPLKIDEVTKNSVPRDDGGTLDGARAEINNLALSITQYLASKAPDVGDYDLFTSSVSVPYYDKQTFYRYADAVLNPRKIFDQISDRSVDSITVDAVKTVYPGLFAEIQKGLLEVIVDKPKELTYTDRKLLGTLFDVPLTDGLKYISVIQESQKNYDKLMSQDRKRRTSQAKLDMSEHMTRSQQLEA